MAQHDYVISNGTGAAVRSDLNNALSAIVTQNSGSTEPTTTYAYQMWADTNAGVMKIRNGANSAWITLYQLDGEWTSIAFENGSAAAPSIYFKDSGTDTGFFSGGTDQVNIATAGTERVEWGTSEVVFNDAGNNYDFRVEGDTNANLLFVDASADAVGIGTSSVGALLHAKGSGGSSSGSELLRLETGQATGGNWISFWDASARKGYIGYKETTDDNIYITNEESGGNVIISGSAKLGIGAATPSAKLEVSGGNIRLDNNQGVEWGGANNYIYGNESTDFIAIATNGDERARIDSSGRWLLGTSSAPTASVVSSALLVVQGYAGVPTGDSLISLQRGQAPASISSGSQLGAITFGANDGSPYAQIHAATDAAGGTNDYPGRLVFSTTADGASSPTERARINNAGEFSFRNTSYVFPATDNAVSLGLTGFRFSAVWAANGTIQTSDERAKADITDAALGSEFIKALRPVSYKWIEGGKRDTGERDEDENYIYESVPGTRTHWGFIAQEVKEAVDAAGVDFGGWVLSDKDDPNSQQALRYDQFIAPLTKALQEALAEIDVLKAKVAALESA